MRPIHETMTRKTPQHAFSWLLAPASSVVHTVLAQQNFPAPSSILCANEAVPD